MKNAAIRAHLSGSSALGLICNELVAQFEIGGGRNFVYLILDWVSAKAAIIDPQKDLSEPLKATQEHGFQLQAVFLTHTHSDHTAGVPELMARFPDISVYVHHDDLHRIRASQHHRFREIRDGQVISIGSIPVEVLHTPGHSSGECCYFVKEPASGSPYLFTGDTVFIRDCGRTDLETGDSAQLFASLQRIAKLPPETVILPGHHYSAECASTVRQEVEKSPAFQPKTSEEFAIWEKS